MCDNIFRKKWSTPATTLLQQYITHVNVLSEETVSLPCAYCYFNRVVARGPSWWSWMLEVYSTKNKLCMTTFFEKETTTIYKINWKYIVKCKVLSTATIVFFKRVWVTWSLLYVVYTRVHHKCRSCYFYKKVVTDNIFRKRGILIDSGVTVNASFPVKYIVRRTHHI